ncbi:MAG: FtsX-like permease family protein, partial [Anaerolineales bacterium]
YLPFAQAPNIGMNLVVRATANPGHLAGAVRQAVQAVDRNQPISPLRPITDLVARQHFRQRLSSRVVGLFAGLALFLAAIGIYGVLAYSVTQRTHEIGVRVALGARRTDVLAMILWHGMRLSIVGVAIGLAGSAVLAHGLSRLLFGISPTDPLTFGGIALLFTLVALLACYVPARRAMRVDPMVALRYE